MYIITLEVTIRSDVSATENLKEMTALLNVILSI
jgi:hypothetical protein